MYCFTQICLQVAPDPAEEAARAVALRAAQVCHKCMLYLCLAFEFSGVDGGGGGGAGGGRCGGARTGGE